MSVNAGAPAGPREGASRAVGSRPHPRCIVCGPGDWMGLGLKFTVREDGSVESRFHCNAAFEGYPHRLHGGVIAMLLDGAMTNCLFAHGHVAVTAELRIRYRHPVATDRPALVRAWIERSTPRLRVVAAELVQDGHVRTKASAKFIDSLSAGSAEAAVNADDLQRRLGEPRGDE